MRQCILERIEDNKSVTLVTWLNDSKIKVGSRLTLKGSTEMWCVKSMSQNRLPKEYVDDRSRDFTRTRKFSDI
jgi:hypothetical protein